jgi:hypothetical protein
MVDRHQARYRTLEESAGLPDGFTFPAVPFAKAHLFRHKSLKKLIVILF